MNSRGSLLFGASLALVVITGTVILAGEPIRKPVDDIVWGPGPPSIPAGARAVTLEGDPKGGGIFTMRVLLPPDYTIPLHTHANDERITVLSGTVFVGIGEAVDRSKETRYTDGSFYVTPTPLRHWVRTDEQGAVLQMTGMGPWTIEYVNPEDDPRNAPTEAKP